MKICVSGYFNPLHTGHLRYFSEAKKLGDTLIVIVNNDMQAQLKDSIFMNEQERLEIIKSIKGVDDAILAIDTDESVSKTLEMLQPDVFAKGGDTNINNIRERKICEKLGIKMVFDIGGEKTQSSSLLRKKMSLKKPKFIQKKWGNEEWLVNNEKYCAKFLNLVKGHQSSFHYHRIKDETFYILEGEVNLEVPNKVCYCLQKNDSYRIYPGRLHRFSAITPTAKILEISTTHCDEDSYRLEKSK